MKKINSESSELNSLELPIAAIRLGLAGMVLCTIEPSVRKWVAACGVIRAGIRRS
jgi:hypothetical protein